MSEVHVNISTLANNSQIIFHNPGAAPVNPNAGQAITQTKDASGKVLKTSGQVPGTSVVHANPA